MKPALSARAIRNAESPIASLMQKALANPQLISLAAGFVDQPSLPVEAATGAAIAALRDPEAARSALQYGSTAGDLTLRQQLIDRLLAQDGFGVRPADDQVLLTAGSNHVLYLLAEALLDPGDRVLCDAPTYFVFTGLVRTAGGECVGIATDAQGMRVDALEAELERHARSGELGRVKAIYITSYFDNPRGVSLAVERRRAVIELAERYSTQHRIYVIEDAAYRELGFAAADQPSIRAHDRDAETVVYAGTFSKSFAPGVRVGFGILPRSLVAPVSSLKGNLDFGAPHLNQRIVSEVLRLGLFEPHVAQLRALYAKKAACMQLAIDEHIVRPGLGRYLAPAGGLFVWLELAPHVDTGERGVLLERALEHGVLYVPGEYCYAQPPEPHASSLRLTFGVQSEERIRIGIEKLARAVRSVS